MYNLIKFFISKIIILFSFLNRKIDEADAKLNSFFSLKNMIAIYKKSDVTIIR